MAKRTVVGMALATVVLGLAAQACTLGSDTYITQKSEVSQKDGGASTATTTSATTTGGTCGTDDFETVDLGKLTACGGGKGHCYDKTKIAGASNYDACPDASQACIPDEFLEAAGQKLKTCKTILGTEGACFTTDPISKIAAMGGNALQKDVCDEGQRCVPCLDPMNGNAPSGFCDAQGAHKNACTGGAAAGAAPAAAAPGCCTTNGKSNGVCIADTAVPEAQRDMIGQEACATGNKCVPSSFVAGKPNRCSAGVWGNGVCMDQCFNNMMAMAGGIGFLEQDACASSEFCIPCLFVSGQGVPGCQ